MSTESPARVSKASLSFDNDYYVIGNVLIAEIQERIRKVAKGDIFSIRGVGVLEVHAITVLTDFEARDRFRGSFNFLKYIIFCRKVG